MNESLQTPEPSYVKVQLSGPPEAVSRLMAALAGAGEVIFDHRAAPDARGDVECRAKVITYGAAGTDSVSGHAAAVVQSVLRVDTGRWPALGEAEDARRLEESTAAALCGVQGVGEVNSRLVAVVPSDAVH
ncbi:hypothetical protein ABZW47_31170 [Streptomyces sp. NPDC004549]|uniref:hypothetical protein n=1 Tax=Streptomyces sp. NPDC004549 TaxID=3154283 RepID=UPI0033A852D5